MSSTLLPVVAPSSELDTQIAFYRANSYLVLPGLLSPQEVAALNAAIDRDQAQNPFMWHNEDEPDYNCNLLLTEPIFETVIRQPLVLALLRRLMGGPFCFEELLVRHSGPRDRALPTDWHRSQEHWREHPLHLDYPQVLYYLTDVDETTHCLTLSPEPAEGEILEPAEQLERRGSVHFYGRAGSAILFNSALLHGTTYRRTRRPRRAVQVFYGHADRPPLSQVTLMPPRLWRDHPDPEIRRFYGKLNRYSQVMLQVLGISTP
ncbi:MAG TPA: phytanoyl-CoA dioxygenase family protein [Chthonomonadaceae bacterium]|nr:phytanoyl-CoA dioxygenase family protein [Chthonomonadaceae bacterium]